MAVIQLDVFLAYPTVEGKAAIQASAFGISVSRADTEVVDAEEDGEADRESHEGQKDPVLSHPKYQFHIAAMPAVTQMVCEEAPWMIVVLVWEKNSHTVIAFRWWGRAVVMPPYYAKVQRTCGSHNSNIRE